MNGAANTCSEAPNAMAVRLAGVGRALTGERSGAYARPVVGKVARFHERGAPTVTAAFGPSHHSATTGKGAVRLRGGREHARDPRKGAPWQESAVEVVSVCTGRAWRVHLAARDRGARRAVEGLSSDRAEWQACETGWQLARSCEYASGADPLIDISVTVERDACLVATLDERTMRVRPGFGSPRAPLRVATAEETVEVGLRWVLGWDHLGCIHPDEFAFWASRMEARVYVAEQVDAWLTDGAHVPLDGLEGRPGIFAAYVGDAVRFGGLSNVVNALDAAYPDALIGAGIFVTAAPGARALIAVADLDECRRMPAGGTDGSL